MARTKSPAVKRTPSEIKIDSNGTLKSRVNGRTDVSKMLDRTIVDDEKHKKASDGEDSSGPGILNLIFSIVSIYGAFLTWAVLQERITTTTYGSSSRPQKWNYPIFLNTVQSSLSVIIGYVYLALTTTHPHKPGRPAPVFPSAAITRSLLFVAVTSSLASPFGYASLKHVDYITFILAKSSKLLPVIFLHTLWYQKKYPLYKYAVIAIITAGVSTFTVYAPSVAGKAAKHNAKNAEDSNKAWGIALLSMNLLLDGVTNTTQDNIIAIFKPYGGKQMQVAMNLLATALTSVYLVVATYLAATPVGTLLGISGTELSDALAFIKAYPEVGWDVLGFSACGALGQIAIYHTLSQFSSLTLTTITVTRKMLTMVLSVIWFGHKITPMQWAGVGLVFGGIGGEAGMKFVENNKKAKTAHDRALSEAGKDRKDSGIVKRD